MFNLKVEFSRCDRPETTVLVKSFRDRASLETVDYAFGLMGFGFKLCLNVATHVATALCVESNGNMIMII